MYFSHFPLPHSGVGGTHLVPQAPQLFESEVKSTQPAPGHAFVPSGHMHLPAMQGPPAQSMPHPPQFLLSVILSEQAPLQQVFPPEQAAPSATGVVAQQALSQLTVLHSAGCPQSAG
jgi:hypothetical protein